ncbi:hypothetical protein L0F63_007030, partial [Massospora cicadina]
MDATFTQDIINESGNFIEELTLQVKRLCNAEWDAKFSPQKYVPQPNAKPFYSDRHLVVEAATTPDCHPLRKAATKSVAALAGGIPPPTNMKTLHKIVTEAIQNV